MPIENALQRTHPGNVVPLPSITFRQDSSVYQSHLPLPLIPFPDDSAEEFNYKTGEIIADQVLDAIQKAE